MTTPYDHRWGRTELLVGAEGVARLARARVAVFGLGGVGGYAAEALARAGVGYLRLVDGDVVETSNFNRQLLALDRTLGRPKAEVAAERVRAINPMAETDAHVLFVAPENVHEAIADIGYAVDAIDMVGAKVDLLAALHRADVFTASCMGAACRRSPTAPQVGDISQTRGCPLAKCVRTQLKRRGISRGIACVFSEEPRQAAAYDTGDTGRGRKRLVLGSISHVPGLFGLMAAGVVIDAILAE